MPSAMVSAPVPASASVVSPNRPSLSSSNQMRPEMVSMGARTSPTSPPATVVLPYSSTLAAGVSVLVAVFIQS